MTDTTNWSCPDCGAVVSSGTAHRCAGPRADIKHPLEAENARLRAALDVTVEGLEHIRNYMYKIADEDGTGPDSVSAKANYYLVAIEAKMQEPPDHRKGTK